MPNAKEMQIERDKKLEEILKKLESLHADLQIIKTVLKGKRK